MYLFKMCGTHSDQYEQKRANWKRRTAGIDTETEKIVLSVLRNGPWYTGGEESESLEREFAEHFHVKHAVSCGSGTAACHLVYIAYGIGEGDEVILPANAFMSPVCALVRERGKPVLVDVEKETYNIDAVKVEEVITSKTKAIMVTHMCGHPADMDVFMELGQKYNIKIIGDTARSLGARYKGKPVCSIPDVTFTSIGSKCIGSGGPAGMMMTSDDELAEKVSLLRGYGKGAWTGEQKYEYFGLNYEIGEINAAIARHQLRKLEKWNEKRRANAKLIDEILADIPAVEVPIEKAWAYSVYNCYLVKIHEKRDALRRYLEKKGSSPKFSGPGHYPFVHMQKIVQDQFGYKEGDFPTLESQVGNLLDLTHIDWTRTKDEVTYLPKLIKDFYSP